MKRMSGDNSRRIALRLTPQEDDEINDFLSTTLKFKTKSEFIRAAIFSYIKGANQVQKPQTISSGISTATLKALEPYVKKGYFDNYEEAIDFIIDKAGSEGFLPAILNKRVKWIADTKKNGDNLPDLNLMNDEEVDKRYE